MGQQGVGLIEVLVTLIIVSVGFLALLRLEVTAYRYLQQASAMSQAQQRAHNQAEQAYAIQ